jgi:hypothetical protein
MANEKNELAEDRTDLAEDRTVLANERTFAGWMQTGLSAVGIASGFHALFNRMEPDWVPGPSRPPSCWRLVRVLVVRASSRRSLPQAVGGHRCADLGDFAAAPRGALGWRSDPKAFETVQHRPAFPQFRWPTTHSHRGDPQRLVSVLGPHLRKRAKGAVFASQVAKGVTGQASSPLFFETVLGRAASSYANETPGASFRPPADCC